MSCNISIQTDKILRARRPDLVEVDKKNTKYQVTDFTVSNDDKINIRDTYIKMAMYQDLDIESQKI